MYILYCFFLIVFTFLSTLFQISLADDIGTGVGYVLNAKDTSGFKHLRLNGQTEYWYDNFCGQTFAAEKTGDDKPSWIFANNTCTNGTSSNDQNMHSARLHYGCVCSFHTTDKCQDEMGQTSVVIAHIQNDTVMTSNDFQHDWNIRWYRCARFLQPGSPPSSSAAMPTSTSASASTSAPASTSTSASASHT
ncbi:unnamed protein product [Periconia digitata]|uniref:Uncharacterized protein n=1 Tax=Periconia digitata TaxID=1303443 RepID=A0A9W4U258_9PLEO|nr:unnamed protein product [Periconia digitata]